MKWKWVALVCAVLLALFLMPIALRQHAKPDHVRRVAHASPELQAAISQAKAGLDGFTSRLKAAPPGTRFAVKGRFDTVDGPEYLWVRDPAFDAKFYVGVLDEAPIAYRAARKGDEVKVPRASVVDWLILSPNGREGDFTGRVLQP